MFYGWVVVGAAFVGQTISSLLVQALATYVVPLQDEFGWSRAAIGVGRSFQQVESVLGPVSGTLVDRLGPRSMMLVGVLLYAAGLTLFSRIENLWTFYAASALMAVANSFCGLLVISTAISHWFRRKRTTALGVALMGLAVGGMIWIPLIVWMQATAGWRAAALWSAAGVLLLGCPAVLVMRTAPELYGLLPDGAPAANADRSPARSTPARPPAGSSEFTVRESLRTRAFWLITIGWGTSQGVQAAVIVYQFAHMEEIQSPETAALVLVVLNVFNLVGRFAGGVLGDRLSMNRVLALDMLGSAASLLVLAVASATPLLLAYGAAYGLTWGIRTPVVGSIQAEYFGRGAYGRVIGLSQTVTAPFAVVGPILVGALADLQGSYRPAFFLCGVVSAASAVLFLLATRPAEPLRPR